MPLGGLTDEIDVKVYRSHVKIPLIFLVPAALLVTLYAGVYLYANSDAFIETSTGELHERLGGHFEIDEVLVEPTLTEVQLYGVDVETPEREPAIYAERVYAAINPLVLLTRRISFEKSYADGAHVELRFDEEGRLGLLEALGMPQTEEDEEVEEEDEERSFSLEFNKIEVPDSSFSYIDPDLEFHIPSIDVPDGTVAIEPEALLMEVDHLEVPRVEFMMTRQLLHMPREWGDWAFTVEDVEVDRWQWANDGFAVERVDFASDGVEATAGGRMNFPQLEDPDASLMTYEGQGTLSSPYWSQLAQYFLDDTVHFELPELHIAAKGSMEHIDGYSRLHASRVETNGLHFRNLRADIALRNQWLDIREASAEGHGGRVEAEDGYLNMYTVEYGGRGRFEGVNPYSVLRDFGFDFPWLDGSARGSVEVHGAYGFDPEPETEGVLGTRDFAARDYADVTATSDWVLERHNRELFPASRVVLHRGATAQADMNTVRVPLARLSLGDDAMLVDDLRFNYNTLRFKRGVDDEPVRIAAYLDDVGPWVEMYGFDGVEGPVETQVTLDGPLASPTASFDLRNRKAPLELVGTEVAAEDLQLRFVLDRGRLDIVRASLTTPLGSASAAGWVDLLEEQPGIDFESEDDSTLAVRSVQPADLSFSADNVDVAALTELAGVDTSVSGLGSTTGRLTGSLQRPEFAFDSDVIDGRVYGQDFERTHLEGGYSAGDWKVEDLDLHAGRAGRLQADGRLGVDGDYAFEMDATGLDLSHMAWLDELPAVAQPAGQGAISLHGQGSLDDPGIGGQAQLEGLRVGERDLGDVALVVNAVDGTVYVTGAVLPLSTVQFEIPLDTDSPYYARLGMEQLELSRVFDEIGPDSLVSRALVTGAVELFVEKDLSRYQVLTNLTDLEVDALDRTIDNRGPIVAGFNNGQVLQIQRAQIGTGDRYVSLRGAMVPEPWLVDMDVEGQVDLSLLETARRAFPDAFPSSLVESRGLLDVDAGFRGSSQEFLADGRLDFEGAQFGVRGLPEPVVVEEGRVNLNRDRVEVDPEEPVRGTALGGLFNLAGQVGLAGAYAGRADLRGWSHNMNFRLPDAAQLSFDTDLRLQALDLFRPETWDLSGSFDVLDGIYYRDISLFEEQLTGRVLGAFDRQTERYEAGLIDQIPELGEVELDLALRARDGFNIRNRIDRLGLDLQLRLDLRLQNTLLDPNLTGDIDVTSGTVGFQGEEFEVRSGTVRYSGEPDNPWIDVVAGADIDNRCRDDQLLEDFESDMTLTGDLEDTEEETYHVILNLQGQADNLDMQFDSNPYADQRDILSLLLTGCTVDQLSASTASGPTLEIALGPLLGRVEREIQDVVKVSEFTIMPGVERTQVRIGDRLTRRLSWNFQLDTGMDETAGGQRYQLEYKLSDRWSTELSERSQSETNNFLLDLKLKYRMPLD